MLIFTESPYLCNRLEFYCFVFILLQLVFYVILHRNVADIDVCYCRRLRYLGFQHSLNVGL